MFDKLFGALPNLTHFKSILQSVENVLMLVEEDYFKDQNIRNAAIDAITEILQAHKVAVVTATPTST